MSGSLEDRVAARREERQRARASLLIIPVPGYKDLLAARYRVLQWEEKMDIVRRHKGLLNSEDGPLGGNTTDTVATAADMLIAACEEILEVSGKDDNGKPLYRSLGQRWTAPMILETFRLPLPPEATVRHALIVALGSEEIIDHFGDYTRECDAILAEGDAVAQGEAPASVAD